jgi:hypothetical protein
MSAANVVNAVIAAVTIRHKIPVSPWGNIPLDIWDRTINLELRRLQLKKSTKKHGRITGDRHLADSTKYYCHYHNFVKFSYSVGDYSSLLMFSEYAPTYCVPPDVNTLVAYCNYRLGEKGTIVVDSTGVSPYLDTKGKEVLCLGGWNDPARLNHFRAAINAVVTARGQGHSYGDACEECVRLYDENDEGVCPGCNFHKGQPLLMRNGNPCTSRTFLNNAKRIKSKSTWRVEGAGQLLPGDMRCVLKALVSQNTVAKLQIAVILILSTYLFLRKDESLSITMEQFHPELTISAERSKPQRENRQNLCKFLPMAKQRMPRPMPGTLLTGLYLLCRSKKGTVVSRLEGTVRTS